VKGFVPGLRYLSPGGVEAWASSLKSSGEMGFLGGFVPPEVLKAAS